MPDALPTERSGDGSLPLLAKAAVITIPFIGWSRDIAVATLVLAGLGLAAHHARGAEMRRLLATPAAIMGALFLAWSMASMLWAPHLPWETWLKSAANIMLGAAVAVMLARLPAEALSRAAGGIVCAALALIALLTLERITGAFFIGLHREAETVFQRLTALSGGLVLLCTTCFACAALLGRYLGALIAYPVWIAGVLAVSLSYPMDAEVAAILCGTGVFAAVMLGGVRIAVALMALLLIGMMCWGFIAESAAAAGLHHWLIANVDPNWGYRIEIWRYVGTLTDDRILAGHGFDSSRILGESAALMPSFQGKTSFLHPHNGMLQVWLELGLVGVLLLAGLAILGFRAFVATRPRRISLACVCATITTSAVIWSLSFGAWQGWWLAVLGLSASCLVIAVRAQAAAAPRTMLFLVTEFYMFDALKKEITQGARERGYEIFVAGRVRPGDAGWNGEFTVVPFAWRRSPSLVASMFFLIPDLVRIGRLFNRVNPEILHNIALKSAVLGSLAAVGRPVKVINAIHGFGFLFTRRDALARLAQAGCGMILRLSARFNDALILLINRDDQALARDRMGVPARNLRLIHGTGIDLARFTAQPEPAGPFTFLVIGRLLYMKGIDVAIEAHRRLRESGFDANLVICGSPDPDNPSSIPDAALENWKNLPGVTFTGQVADVRPHIAGCHALVHPSLGGEGLPRALTEAAAMQRALIATAIPGNTEVVVPHETGLLVAPGDAGALAEAMRWMIEHPAERRALAFSARTLVERKFASAAVANQHTAAIQELASARD